MDWTQFKQTLCDDLRPNALDVMNPYVTINAVMPMVEYQAAEIVRLKAELELRTRELQLAREGKVFLSGGVYCSAMIATKILDWDALTAMTFTPENEQIEYANSAEEFRSQAEAHLAGRGV